MRLTPSERRFSALMPAAPLEKSRHWCWAFAADEGGQLVDEVGEVRGGRSLDFLGSDHRHRCGSAVAVAHDARACDLNLLHGSGRLCDLLGSGVLGHETEGNRPRTEHGASAHRTIKNKAGKAFGPNETHETPHF